MMSHPVVLGILLLVPIGLLVNLLAFDRIRDYRSAAVVSGVALVACLLAEGLLIAG